MRRAASSTTMALHEGRAQDRDKKNASNPRNQSRDVGCSQRTRWHTKRYAVSSTTVALHCGAKNREDTVNRPQQRPTNRSKTARSEIMNIFLHSSPRTRMRVALPPSRKPSQIQLKLNSFTTVATWIRSQQSWFTILRLGSDVRLAIVAHEAQHIGDCIGTHGELTSRPRAQTPATPNGWGNTDARVVQRRTDRQHVKKKVQNLANVRAAPTALFRRVNLISAIDEGHVDNTQVRLRSKMCVS